MMELNRNLFWKLVEPEHQKVRGFCRKLTGNREDGDDLYQDALVTALLKLDNLRDKESFKPWLYRIIINSFRNKIRKPWWKIFSPLTKEIEETVSGNDPFAVYAARRRLSKAFRVLSADDQALVTLYELEGWQIAEIADLYNKKKGAVKMRLSRARMRMRKALTKLPPSEKEKVVKIFETEDEICVATKPGKN